jgi:uncharacterized membrane protein
MMQFPTLKKLVTGHFFTGLLVVIPFAVIFWILMGVLGALWSLHTIFPEGWLPSWGPITLLFNLGFTLLTALVLALSISVVGWTSKQFLGRKILKALAELIDHIPVIRSIYGALTQLLQTLAAGGGGQFSHVVYVEYPRKGSWALAFVTSPARAPMGGPEKFLNLYVPTTPNPTSGFHLIVAESDVRESNLSVEEAFRTILSLGIAAPEAHDSIQI